MVQKKEQNQEQNIYSPYYYPNFSRYNYPSKIGGDEDIYTEPKFSFPCWDDEVQPYTPPTPLLRRRASSPFSCTEDIDYFNNKLLSDNNNTMLNSNTTMIPSSDTSESEDESEAVCEKIQSDIDLARKDQKSDYDQFRKTYATIHDDIRAIQREIEAIEAICMKNVWDLKRGGATVNDDGTEIYYEPSCNNKSTNPTNNIKGGRLASIPSAVAAARSSIGKKRSSPSILYRNKVKNQQEQQQNTFNDNNNNNNNSNNRRCLGIEDGWLQDRVHQNEGIRC